MIVEAMGMSEVTVGMYRLKWEKKVDNRETTAFDGKRTLRKCQRVKVDNQIWHSDECL